MKDIILPGKLGNSKTQLKDDPRLDPRILEKIIPYSMEVDPESPELTVNSSEDEKIKFLSESESDYQSIFADFFPNVKTPDNVKVESFTIKSSDNLDINLHIHRPVNQNGDIPCVLHTHGGGMSILTAEDPNYVSWRNKLAGKGMLVVGVDFRNVAGVMGNNPFPAGLNDCYDALNWVHDNKKKLQFSKLIISGESGGGNLSIATALKANVDCNIHMVDGVYSQCPYISNHYDKSDNKLISLHENDGYFLSASMMEIMASCYDGKDSRDPLAWPYHAKKDILTGLPPHFICVNELDPLRDEGLVFFRMLLDAGVEAKAMTLHGTIHAGELIFGEALPELYDTCACSVYDFAKSL